MHSSHNVLLLCAMDIFSHFGDITGKSLNLGGGWMIFHFSIVQVAQVNFVFCQLYFIVLFPFLMICYNIVFIIFVF